MNIKKQDQTIVFMDRDGVININKPGYIKSWDEFEFIPGVLDLFRIFHEKEFKVAIITNQSMLARGFSTIQKLNYIHHRMLEEIQKRGGNIEKIYYCPHHPNDNCSCRKPKPGMLLKAKKEMDISFKNSYFIGDSFKDIEAGSNVGCKTILLLNNRIDINEAVVKPNFCIENILDASDIII